jgi:hypothetical protein
MLRDKSVTLGGATLVAHLTAGHTRLHAGRPQQEGGRT